MASITPRHHSSHTLSSLASVAKFCLDHPSKTFQAGLFVLGCYGAFKMTNKGLGSDNPNIRLATVAMGAFVISGAVSVITIECLGSLNIIK